jgi:hypothetical protein
MLPAMIFHHPVGWYMDGASLRFKTRPLETLEEKGRSTVLPRVSRHLRFDLEGDMSAEIGCWVRWGKFSPTRLGYKPSDIGKVISVRHSRSGAREIDVQFADGDVVRGAWEQWFEGAPFVAEDEIAPNSSLEQPHFF